MDGPGAIDDPMLYRICYDVSMRTALTINDGIAQALNELAHRSNKLRK